MGAVHGLLSMSAPPWVSIILRAGPTRDDKTNGIQHESRRASQSLDLAYLFHHVGRVQSHRSADMVAQRGRELMPLICLQTMARGPEAARLTTNGEHKGQMEQFHDSTAFPVAHMKERSTGNLTGGDRDAFAVVCAESELLGKWSDEVGNSPDAHGAKI